MTKLQEFRRIYSCSFRFLQGEYSTYHTPPTLFNPTNSFRNWLSYSRKRELIWVLWMHKVSISYILPRKGISRSRWRTSGIRDLISTNKTEREVPHFTGPLILVASPRSITSQAGLMTSTNRIRKAGTLLYISRFYQGILRLYISCC